MGIIKMRSFVTFVYRPDIWFYNINLFQVKPNKRFSMNYMDSLDQDDPNSWDSALTGSARSGRVTSRSSSSSRSSLKSTSGGLKGHKSRLRPEASRKRSDAKAAVLKAKMLSANIEMVTAKAVDKYGIGFVCAQEEWREALGVLRFLRVLLRDQRPFEFACT